MIDFTLSKNRSKTLPEAVTVGGNVFSICSNFRTVLKILRMLDDPDLPSAHKRSLALSWFYQGTLPEESLEDAMKAFQTFVRRNEHSSGSDASKPVFDYEQDAVEIYASFMHLYRIDLLGEENLHWWTFSALLDGALQTDCALREKIRIRVADPSKYQDPSAIREAQALIEIKTPISREELKQRRKVSDILTGGGDVSAALEALKNGL